MVVNPSDIHYRLYQDCIRHLEETCPIESLKYTDSIDFGACRALACLQPAFGTLSNLLADRYPAPDAEGLTPGVPITLPGLVPSGQLSFRQVSVLDFILSGMLAARRCPGYPNLAYTLRESRAGLTESDLYQALFLDRITPMWVGECYLRSKTVDWSPMPWSRASSQESSSTQATAGQDQIPVRIVGEADLADEHDPIVQAIRMLYGTAIDIPWFGARHDGYPFSTTLSSYTKARRSDVNQSLRDDVAVWVGSMTFGVLEIVTRTRIPESLFLLCGEHQQKTLLSGTRILRFLVNWGCLMGAGRWYIHPISGQAHIQHGREVARVLDRVLNALDEEQMTHASIFLRAGCEAEVPEVVCAITLTVSLLCNLAHGIWSGLSEMARLKRCIGIGDQLRDFYGTTIKTCANKMYEAGWCRYMVAHPFMFKLGPGLAIASNLVSLRPHIRHAPNEHQDCTEDACTFYTIADTTKYIPSHVEPSCHCEYIKPPLSDVTRLLSDGLVPAVVYDGKSLRVQAIDVAPYVAISHVWADGMGSITEHGLPVCVIQRISHLVHGLLPDSKAFWMDSLCVPGVGTLRKVAIKLMARTYHKAAKVLVLDKCIKAECSKARPWEENLLRIATSGWVRRVWTLQEGLLARELYFEFADGPISVEAGLKYGLSDAEIAQGVAANNMGLLLGYKWCSTLVPLLAERAQNRVLQSSDHRLTLDKVIYLLTLRTTTKPEDELIAISSLVRMDVDAILAITGADAAQRRIREFLLQQSDVPKAIAAQITPRLALPGFSWAPRTLVSALEGADASVGTGVCTPEGLIAEYFVALFEDAIDVPPELEDGRKPAGYANVRIIHGSPAVLYMLDIYPRVGPVHATSFDGLLFLQGDLSGVRGSVQCIAVCRTGGQRECAELDVDALHPFTYVAPCHLQRTPLDPAMFAPGNAFVMAELQELTVMLS
ncbi:hypothetical protein C8Q77DRAFT_1156259 [Trametes polyzona]|nr:hypothetical protein C8Q77DRAFT_1156259 [Trametes polyzona]